MKNLQSIEVIYYGPTNTKGGRIKLVDHRFNATKWIPYNYSKNNIVDMATEYLEGKGFNLVGETETKKGYMLLSDTFKSIKDK